MSVTVSAATAVDIEALKALVNGAYRGKSGGRGWTSEAELIVGQRTDAKMIAWYERRGYHPTGETLATTRDAKYGVPKRGGLYLERRGRDL